MKYTIIEDCSPYYIRFTFDGLENIINYASSITPVQTDLRNPSGGSLYSHDTLGFLESKSIISMLPMSDIINFNNERVAVFNTPPGGGCGIHKDGTICKTSFNIPLVILDNNCVTNWYADEIFTGFPLTGDRSYTRNVYPDYKTMNRFTSIKTMIAKPNEMLLFNTDIYHSWNNICSRNTRKILSLRAINAGLISFEDTKQMLFGY
jgi:hypothetical protein